MVGGVVGRAVAAARGFSFGACCWNLSMKTHRVVFPRVVRYGGPALVTAIFVSALHPAVLLVVAGIAVTMVALSLLPEGHALLQYAYVREAHRCLGCVVAARQPPPFLHLGDAQGIDALGLLELLRRRCSYIIVCDATLDVPCHLTEGSVPSLYSSFSAVPREDCADVGEGSFRRARTHTHTHTRTRTHTHTHTRTYTHSHTHAHTHTHTHTQAHTHTHTHTHAH